MPRQPKPFYGWRGETALLQLASCWTARTVWEPLSAGAAFGEWLGRVRMGNWYFTGTYI